MENKLKLKIPCVTAIAVYMMIFFIHEDFTIKWKVCYIPLVALIVVDFILKIIRKEKIFNITVFEKLYILLLGVIALNLCRTDIVWYHGLFVYAAFIFIVSCYFIFSSLKENEDGLIFNILTIGTIVIALFELAASFIPSFTEFWTQFISDSSREFNINIMNSGYSFCIGGDVSYVAYVMMLGVTVSILQFYKFRKILNLLPGILCFFVIVILGRRGELLAMILSICLLLVLLDNPKKRLKHILIGLVVLFLGFILFILLLPVFKKVDFLQRYISTFERMLLGKDISSGRSELYSLAWNAFKEHPLLGIGWGNFAELVPEHFGSVRNVHNIYLQFLCETGIFSGLLISGLLIVIFVVTVILLLKCLKLDTNTLEKDIKIKISQYLIFSVMTQSFMLFLGLVDPVFYKETFLLIYGMSLIFASSAYKIMAKNGLIKSGKIFFHFIDRQPVKGNL